MSIPSVSFQPSRTEQEALSRAALLWGIEPEYRDTWGKLHTTLPEAQKAILKALGVPCETKECLDRAMEEKLWREWSSILPPTLVVSQTPAIEVPLSVPRRLANNPVTVALELEDGSCERFEANLSELADCAAAELRGQSFVRKRLALPKAPPLGYHAVRVSVAEADQEPVGGVARLIVCPDRAWLPPQLAAGGRTAGVSVSLYGVRSHRNWGCGDFTDLKGVIDWVAEDLGGSFVVLNPLHAIHNRRPYNTSPYLPNSIFFRNFIYLDVEQIEDIKASPLELELLAASAVHSELKELRSSPYVEYERVHALKLSFLRLAFDVFEARERAGSPRRSQFEEYCRGHGELLERFATYCALDEWIHGQHPEIWVWPDWPEEYHDPGSDAVKRFAEEHRGAVEFYKYVQWQCELQLAEAQQHAERRGMVIGLFHDLALATDRCGADLWAHRDHYVAGCRVGAPPDGFSPKGQDWAFPPPDAERHRDTGYHLFIESIRQNCRHGGALRIDHAMRFFRLFWIPEGMEAAQGTYVRDFHEDLLRIVALESVRNKVLIVGEDLGTVAPGLREAFDRLSILSYRLVYFERTQEGEFRLPAEYPRRALVSVTTHDLPTLAGYWECRDIEARRTAGLLQDSASYQALLAERARDKQKILDLLFRLGLLPEWFPRSAADIPELTGELHNAVVGFLASTPSMLLSLMQEDLLKETEQQNLPSTTSQYPNWQRKMRFTLEELRSEGQPADFAAMFRHWIERTGRR